MALFRTFPSKFQEGRELEKTECFLSPRFNSSKNVGQKKEGVRSCSFWCSSVSEDPRENKSSHVLRRGWKSFSTRLPLLCPSLSLRMFSGAIMTIFSQLSQIMSAIISLQAEDMKEVKGRKKTFKALFARSPLFCTVNRAKTLSSIFSPLGESKMRC